MNRIVVMLLFMSGIVSAQPDSLLSDTAIYFRELVFTNALEEKVFTGFHENKKADPLALFYVIGEQVNEEGLHTASSQLNELIATLRSRSLSSKKPAKKIKLIYGATHDTFLKKYELKNGFNELFETGNYNCVSATALYAIIFDNLDIPYAIKVLPTHVYLVAYPEGEQIMIETTDPVFGYYEYDKKFQLEYAEHLVSTKFISQDEFIVKGYEAIFREYFFPQDQVDLKQLAGLQYFNKGIYEFEEEDYTGGVAYLEKAMFLHADQRIAFSLIAAYGLALKDAEYKEEKEIDYLLRMMRYEELLDDKEYFQREFYKITGTHLLANNDTAYYEAIYKRIMEATSDEKIKKEFSMMYYLSRAEVCANQLQYDQSEKFMMRAYELEPGNQQLLNDLVVTIIRNLENKPSRQVAMEYLLKAEKNLPELIANPKYLAYKADVCARLMAQAFGENERNKGESYRNTLERLLEKGVNNFVITQNIAIAYSNAASSYYRSGNKSMARQLLNKGLEYAPGNYELTSRLKTLR